MKRTGLRQAPANPMLKKLFRRPRKLILHVCRGMTPEMNIRFSLNKYGWNQEVENTKKIESRHTHPNARREEKLYSF
jgi:hypothetical protein